VLSSLGSMITALLLLFLFCGSSVAHKQIPHDVTASSDSVCFVLDDLVEVATLAATSQPGQGRAALTCHTEGVICSTNTFDGRCRVVAVPANRGLQLDCKDSFATISLPALVSINTTFDASGALSFNGCNAVTISFPRLKSVVTFLQPAG
jgi:hypothetical protein